MAHEAWQPTAFLLAAHANANRDEKKRRTPFSPMDFDRYCPPRKIIKKRQPISALRMVAFPGLADNPLLKQLDEAKANDAKRVST